MSNILLKAENISKRYNGTGIVLDAVKHASLSVKKSEILALVGPSGAGKSTLLHMLGGLDRPSRGKVFFDGVDLYKVADKERSSIRNKSIGFVFQFYHLLDDFTAIENVMMPAMLFCRSRALKKQIQVNAANLLEAVGVMDRSGHRPSQVSGGEAQRISIARALINNPDIVLCDEPTGNLDSENAHNILKLVRSLNEKFKQAFLIVTHNEQISDFAHRVIRMEDGRLK
jgi:ABC-type lipoprotein export system ATPase subunit